MGVPELTQELLRHLSPAELRDLDGLLAGMEVTRATLLRYATDAELDRLDRPNALPGELAAVLGACARRMAAGEPPFEQCAAARDLERSIYWTELLPKALQCYEAIDYEQLHAEARRLAAERR